MSMTDDDVKTMADEVLATPIESCVEKAWASAQRQSFLTAEQSLMVEWKLHRFMRDDKRMQQTAADLKRIRACLKYVTELLEAHQAEDEKQTSPAPSSIDVADVMG